MSPLASQCAQHCSDERNFADSGDMCSGVVDLGLVLAMVLAQEMQDSRPQHFTHVRLAHQVSHYYHQICRPRFLTSCFHAAKCSYTHACMHRSKQSVSMKKKKKQKTKKKPRKAYRSSTKKLRKSCLRGYDKASKTYKDI